MARNNRRASVDELAKLTAELIDHVKVLVTAVDDLRCEVEWWARNAADERWDRETEASCRRCQMANDSGAKHADRTLEDEFGGAEVDEAVNVMTACRSAEATATKPGAVSPSTADQLAALEESLKCGHPVNWPEGWNEDEPPELPVGSIIQVDEEVWDWVLDMRPAHVVQLGCCCEEGIGAPYLLAWQSNGDCFLRELTDAESVALQRACLAAQQEAPEAIDPTPPTTQLDLWRE